MASDNRHGLDDDGMIGVLWTRSDVTSLEDLAVENVISLQLIGYATGVGFGICSELRINERTLEKWEQGRAKPNRQAAALVLLVRRFPDTLARLDEVAEGVAWESRRHEKCGAS